MKTKRTRWWLKSAALLCATVFGLTAFGYDNGGRYIAETETFSEPTSIEGDVWIGNNNTGVFTESQSFVWASSDGDNAGATLTGWLRVADWGGTEAQPLYGNLDIRSGTYTAGGLQVGGSTPDYTYAWATLSGGKLTVSTVNVGSTGENAGTATLTLNGGTLSTTSVTGTGTLAVGANGGTLNITSEEAEVSVPVALTGSGTLTVTSTAPLSFTGNVSAFKGKIAVAAGSGAVTLAGVTVAAGEEVQFGGYTWVGGGADNKWSTLDNWRVNGAVPTAPPAADSTVVIPEGDGTELTVLCGTADYSGKLTINRNLRIGRVGNGYTENEGLHITSVEGTGTLILSGGTRGTPVWRDFVCVWGAGSPNTISCDLEVYGWVALCDQTSIVLDRALKGTGNIRCGVGISGNYTEYPNSVNPGNGQYGIQFNKGDVSQFTGTYVGGLRNHGNRDKTQFLVELEGQNASWTFGWDDSANERSPFRAGDGKTYKFGQLNTIIPYSSAGTSFCYALNMLRQHTSKGDTYNKNCVIEVGAKASSTSTVGGSLGDNSNVLRKVGATSTLNFTATESVGTVEAKEGTTVLKGTIAPAAVKFAGTGAKIKIARSTTTTTEVDSGKEDDESTTDVDESKTTTTTTTDNIAASFVPTFIDDFAGYQYSVAQETTDGVAYDVYTVVKVAKDSSDTEYYSVAEAITALAESEDKTITLIANYDTAIALPLDYTLVMNGYTATVSGAAGVAVSYNEETGTWTTVDNSEATWQGGAEGNWFDANNWSSGYVPDAGTAVTFTGNATVFLAGNNTYDCGSIYIERGHTVTFAPVGYNEDNWPRVTVHGDITSNGNCVLKLYHCGIDNGTTERVTVRPTLQFYNTTGDSWVTGNFKLQASLEGTGEFRVYGGTLDFASGSGITVNDGSVVDFRDYYPTFTGSGGTLDSTGVNGDGRIIVHALPTESARIYFQNAFKNAERWSGTLELAGVTEKKVHWLSDFGNANSTLCFNNYTTYLYTSNDTSGSHSVGTMEIGAGGFKINGNYSGGNFVLPGKLTGTGTFTLGTAGSNNKSVQFTGDCSEFQGSIAMASDTANTRVLFGTTTRDTFAAKSLVVGEDASVSIGASATWNFPGGAVVDGELTIKKDSDNGSGDLIAKYSPNYISGSGTIIWESGVVKNTSNFGLHSTAWTGTVVLGSRNTSSVVYLGTCGVAGSKIVVKGFTGTTSNSIYLDSTSIPAQVELQGKLTLQNGMDGNTYTFADVKGTGDMLLSATGNSGNIKLAYVFTKLTDYIGTINAVKTSDDKYASLAIGTVAVSEVTGEPAVKLAANANLTTDPAAIAVEVGGEATEAKLFKADDGNLYVAVASVTVTPEEGDPVTTPFATYAAAAAFADANGVSTFAVLYGNGVLNGWDYNSEDGTLTKNATAIARVGTTNYETLAAAVTAAGADGTVVLFGNSVATETVTVPAGVTVDVASGVTLAGKVTGAGTVVLASAVTDALVDENWTGTVVLNWTLTGGINVPTYCNSNSTLALAGSTGCYFAAAGGADPKDLAAFNLRIDGDVKVNNAWPSQSAFGKGVAIKNLSGTGNLTFDYQGGYSTYSDWIAYYSVETLGEIASITLANHVGLKISSVQVGVAPDFGDKVVALTVNDGSYLYNASTIVDGAIATDVEGVVLARGADGLYRAMAVANGVGYLTLAEAIAAANGATVELLGDTTDGYEVQAGQTVVIKFGEYSTGTIAAATDYILNTSWDDATKTGTYTTTAVAAYLTVGETVTPYTVAFTALTDFIASATGSTLRFVGTNPFADTAVPCTTYDAATLTYTKLAAVAQIGTGVAVIPYPTLAEACAAAEQYGYNTVTLLVALGEQTVPDGWDYNAPETSGTEFGTLTKEMTVTYNVWFVDTDGSTPLAATQTVESGATATKPAEDPVKEGKVFVAWTLGGTAYDFTTPVTATITLIASWKDAPTGTEADDGSGNKFTVPATVATPADKTLTDAATGTINYAQAYALGLWDGTAEGEVDEPTVSINIVDGKVQVAFAGGTVPEAYTVTTILQYKTTLGTSEWQNVTGATGALGDPLVDPSEMGANKFYRVIVTITNK